MLRRLIRIKSEIAGICCVFYPINNNLHSTQRAHICLLLILNKNNRINLSKLYNQKDQLALSIKSWRIRSFGRK